MKQITPAEWAAKKVHGYTSIDEGGQKRILTMDDNGATISLAVVVVAEVKDAPMSPIKNIANVFYLVEHGGQWVPGMCKVVNIGNGILPKTISNADASFRNSSLGKIAKVRVQQQIAKELTTKNFTINPENIPIVVQSIVRIG